MRCALFIAVSLSVAVLWGESNGNTALRDIHDVCAAIENLRFGTKFDVQATVTGLGQTYSEKTLFTVQSGDAAISCWNHTDDKPVSPRIGDFVRIVGVLNHGQTFRLAADCTQIEILSSHNALPPVRNIQAKDLLNPGNDNLRVRIEGVLTDVLPDEFYTSLLYLVIRSDNEIVYANVWEKDAPAGLLENLGARIAVEGIYRGHLGYRLLMRKSLVVTGSNRITILDRPQPTPLPDSYLYGEMPSSAFRKTARTHYIDGRVVAVWGKNQVLIVSGTRNLIHAELVRPILPKVGSDIRLTGFLESDLFNLILVRATWSPTPDPTSATNAPPAMTTTDARLRRTSGNLPGFDFSFHGRPIVMSGLVRSRPMSNGDGIFYIENEKQIVPIDVSALDDFKPDFDIGCTLEVTGVCIMETGKIGMNGIPPGIHGYRIVVRTPSDIRVIARPPWWTPQRLLVVIALMAAGLVGLFIRNRLLRRLSAAKLAERTRLAIELHDTLAQNLTGAAFGIDAVGQLIGSDPKATASILAQITHTLQSCRDELRSCIWDLRSQALEEPDMNAAIRKTLEPHVDEARIRIRFAVPRESLSDDCVHIILRIIRELVTNALRHGKATVVRIAGIREKERILLSVIDNGCGFDTARAPGIQQGHFGMQGVRERIKEFNGTAVWTSGAKGTKVRISFAPHVKSKTGTTAT